MRDAKKKGFNKDYINRLLEAIFKGAESGIEKDFQDPNDIAQFVCSILALGAGMIPGVGPVMSAATSLMGQVLFGGNSTEKLWDQLRGRIEKLMNKKIGEYHVGVLKAKIQGMKRNMESFRKCVKAFDDETTEDQKRKAAETLHICHGSFLLMIRGTMPEFQMEGYMVLSLLLFVAVANMHLTLLVDGIKHGSEWGYSNLNINDMRVELKELVSPDKASHTPDKRDWWTERRNFLKDAIKKGPELGVPVDVVDTWKTAYVELFVSEPRGGDNGYGELDYVSYAKEIVKLGRKAVKIDDDGWYPLKGTVEGTELRCYCNYDRCMIVNVLNYVELWPYMGNDENEEIPEQVIRNLDREVFFGPLNRFGAGAKWSKTDMPPIEDCRGRIMTLVFKGDRCVEAVRITYKGGIQEDPQGNMDFNSRKIIHTIRPCGWIREVKVWSGIKVARLELRSSLNDKIVTGKDTKVAGDYHECSIPGYQLTSIKVTNYNTHPIHSGLEGIILGFRPIMTNEEQDFLRPGSEPPEELLQASIEGEEPDPEVDT